MKITRWSRLKSWLVFKLLKGGIPIEIEARHGAFRTRKKELWKGGLVRVDIPLQQKHGVTDTPFGRVSSEDAQKLIDAFTGVEGEHPLQELRPGRGKFEKIEGGKKVCATCGGELEL